MQKIERSLLLRKRLSRGIFEISQRPFDPVPSYWPIEKFDKEFHKCLIRIMAGKERGAEVAREEIDNGEYLP